MTLMANQLPEWMRPMVDAVGDNLMRSLVADFRKGPAPPGPTLPTATPTAAGRVVTPDVGPKYRAYEEGQGQEGGWTKPPSIDSWKPPGLSHMDRMMDQADALDRAQRAAQLVEAAKNLRLLAEAEAELRAPVKDEEAKERPETKGG
jgi:hypothetical protein